MECHQQHRTISICRALSLYDTGWQVQADQEDGTVEINALSTTSSPTFVGFFVCWMMDNWHSYSGRVLPLKREDRQDKLIASLFYFLIIL